jgi:hypothetical protein
MKAWCARCGTEIDPVTTFCTGCSVSAEALQSARMNGKWPSILALICFFALGFWLGHRIAPKCPACPAPPTASSGGAGSGGGGGGHSGAGGGGKGGGDIDPHAKQTELGVARLASSAPLAESFGDAPSAQGKSAPVEVLSFTDFTYNKSGLPRYLDEIS